MSEMRFNTANIPVGVAAKALGVDAQTVRLLLQSGTVEWGIAYRRTPRSKHFSYIVYPRLFYEATGFAYRSDKEATE